MSAVQHPAEDLTETARLRAVDELHLGATVSDERFDRITRVAKSLFRMPMATITLMGRDRQFLVSSDDPTRAPVPREHTICHQTIQDGTLLVIEDLAQDPRFAANPFVRGEPHLRFYAGHPLRSADGQLVGTLCLLDLRPRRLNPAEIGVLAELALWTQSEFNRSIELDRAAEVQRGLLPDRYPLDVAGHQLAATCVPSRTVSGDLVDYYRAPDGDLIVTLGDVTGKGTGAAIMMATVRAAMRSTGRGHPPAEAVHQGAASLDEDLHKTGTIVTLSHLRIDPSTGAMARVDAGHGLFLHIRDGAVLPRRGPSGLPLGVWADDHWPEIPGELLPGDTVVSFSDGLLDLYDGIDAAFADVLRAVDRGPDAHAVVRYFETLAQRHPVPDDVTLFVLHRNR